MARADTIKALATPPEGIKPLRKRFVTKEDRLWMDSLQGPIRKYR